MKREEVPQDNAKTFAGERKALYAVDNDGHYGLAPSSGWEAEEIVLELAIDQYKTLTETALQKVAEGKASPLAYHMYKQRMDTAVLAQSTGFFKWQVRRHCNKPALFASLSEAKLQRYTDALGITLDELSTTPDLPLKASHTSNQPDSEKAE